MTRPGKRQVAAAMWDNRPTSLELLLWMILALIGAWATGVPLALFLGAVGLLLVAETLQMARSDLRKVTAEPVDRLDEGGGHNAD